MRTEYKYSIRIYRLMFLPRYVLNTNCERHDDDIYIYIYVLNVNDCDVSLQYCDAVIMTEMSRA